MQPSLRTAVVGVPLLATIGTDAIVQTPVPVSSPEEAPLSLGNKEVQNRIITSALMEAGCSFCQYFRESLTIQHSSYETKIQSI